MLNKEEEEHYNRQIILDRIGIQGQEKLKNSKILVVGAGGTGCPALQYLSTAGVGTIGIIDFDIISKSNLQRQILFGYNSIGKSKVIEAKQSLKNLNPHITYFTYNEKLDSINAKEIIKNYDIIVDCSDNYSAKYIINDICFLLNKIMVYGAIYKFEGQISVFNYKDGPSYRCIFPEVPNNKTPSCSEIGVIGVLPGIIGCMQANEVIKIILDIGEVLSGKLLLYNALSCSNSIIKIQKQTHEIYNKIFKTKCLDENDYNFYCSNTEISEINEEEFKSLLETNIQIIDVREIHEQPIINILNSIQIPLNTIEDNINIIERNKKVIIFCRSGRRSQSAINILQNNYNFTNLYNLKDGIKSLNFILKH